MGKDLSDDQVSSMKEAFTLFDTDGDGKIAPSELGILMRSLGGNPTQAQLKSIIAEEKLSAPFDFQRFLDLMSKHLKPEPFDRQLRDAFKVLDKDGTGYVVVSDLRHILTSIGEKLEPAEFDEWIREVDVGSDGKIRYEDFIARMVANNRTSQAQSCAAVSSAVMGRMHSRGKGISASALPYKRTPPSWLKTSSQDVEENICKFAKKGLTPSQIGVILRDSHGIAQVKSVTGSKILRILKAHGLAPEIPEDLYHLIKKAVAIRKHLERNRKDKDSKFRLILVESRIHRLARYYKKTKKLPPVWKYESTTASTLVA
ncbi:40S ribosomal protein S13-2 [Striga hermonthica]|uniref:40S ribosomal protein S13-2 n=1 Tax=Striga hermonthica TaxID=68872 RepID=A0A9N7NTW8_STRHE|nr:40S ribosomal protein S13-2 [Striga hermonthica]